MNVLLPIALAIFPDLMKLLAGDRAGTLGEKVVDTIKEVTKAESETEVRQKLEDPVLKADLQKRLAEIAFEETKEQNRAREEQRRIELDFIKEELQEAARQRDYNIVTFQKEVDERENIRHLQSSMAAQGNAIAWVNPVLSMVIVFGFLYILYSLMTNPDKIINSDMFNIGLGALGTAFATVIAFHFGSSVGSKNKDDQNRLRLEKEIEDDNNRRIEQQAAKQAEKPAGEPTTSPSTKQTSTVSSSSRFALFEKKAPEIMRKLIADLGITPQQAAGVLGNIGHECAGFKTFQEVKPLKGRGGWGWCQWTAERRVAFEQWANQRGFDFASDEANYGFLVHELRGSEADAFKALRATKSVSEATEVFLKKFERAGVEHLDMRLRWAERAMKVYS